MRYINLAMCAMIVTGFLMKVIRKFKNAQRTSPYSSIANYLGVDISSYETAVSNAKKNPDWNILLFFHFISDHGAIHTKYYKLGNSLGPVCDAVISNWCKEHIGIWQAHAGTYEFQYVDIQPIEFVNYKQQMRIPPMNADDIAKLLKLYNSLLAKPK